MQKVSSMNTSINTTKLPSVWGKVNFAKINPTNIVDYGCGKFQTQMLVQSFIRIETNTKGVYFGYDPYWGDVNKNRNAISCLTQWKTCDLCVCANVINVIDDVETIKEIIKEVTQAKNWIFQIYEGNKSGEGKYTKGGTCWQHNKKTKEYCWIFNELLEQPYYIKENLITNNLEILK